MGSARFSPGDGAPAALSLSLVTAQAEGSVATDCLPVQVQPATRQSYRDAMRAIAGAVCVVTFGCGEGKAGLTATSVVSLSADPPTVLFCIQRNASAYASLALADAFAVNVLAAGQQEFAERFSGTRGLRGSDRYHGDDWFELPSGVSGLRSGAAILDCAVEERLERATHAILIGRVRNIVLGDGCGALLYWQAAYDQLGWGRDEIARATGLSPRGAG